MKERGIIFSAPMVRAILADRKTQTRRIVKPQPAEWDANPAFMLWRGDGPLTTGMLEARCPYGGPGDRLWSRETWYDDNALRDTEPPPSSPDDYIYYRADGEAHQQFEQTDGLPLRWKPSIFMPRWASRITLEITAVRAERVQEISEEDARAEGVDRGEGMGIRGYPSPQAARLDLGYRGRFAQLWDQINSKRAPWSSNPWVWVVEFRRLPDCPIAAES